MRLWCWPGVTFELGQFTILVAPPERMAALLDLPEITSFHTRYLHHGRSEVLLRVPPIRSEQFEAVACETLNELMAAVGSSFHTVLMVEWNPALVAGLDVEERGRRMTRLTAALQRRAESAIVIVYAQAVDGALRQMSTMADQTTWLVPRPTDLRPTVKVVARMKAQRTLF